MIGVGEHRAQAIAGFGQQLADVRIERAVARTAGQWIDAGESPRHPSVGHAPSTVRTKQRATLP